MNYRAPPAFSLSTSLKRCRSMLMQLFQRCPRENMQALVLFMII